MLLFGYPPFVCDFQLDQGKRVQVMDKWVGAFFEYLLFLFVVGGIGAGIGAFFMRRDNRKREAEALARGILPLNAVGGAVALSKRGQR